VARPLILFAPGAGAPSTSAWMEGWARRLATIGGVVRFDYPYVKEGRRPPDRIPVLIAAHLAALEDARESSAPRTTPMKPIDSLESRLRMRVHRRKTTMSTSLRHPFARLAIRSSLAGVLVTASAFAEEISVTHWGVQMYGAPYAVAMRKGYFEEKGVHIDGILTSKGGGTTMRNVLASGLPYGEVAVSAAVAAARAGINVRIVNAGVVNVGEILWVTLPDSAVKTIKDLQGRKVGYTSPKSITDMLTIMALQAQGIPLDKVQRVAVGGIGAQLTALEQGGIDAAFMSEPVWTKEKGKYRPVFYVKDVLPSKMTQTVGVTTAEFAKSNPDKLRAIIAARRKGVEFIYANPKEAAAIVAKTYGLDPKIVEESLANLIALKYWSAGEFDIAGMNAMVKGLQLVGDISGPVDWDTLIDRGFLN
jgi:NitT/TauT family transport system substrate-binding protein